MPTKDGASVALDGRRPVSIRRTGMTKICPQSTYVPVPNVIPLLKGVEIPINRGGGGDQVKIAGRAGTSTTGVGEALKKNRLMRSKVARSTAFITAKQWTRSPPKRITQSSTAFLGPTHPPAISDSEDSAPLKIEANRADIVDKNENVTCSTSSNVSRPVSEIRMVYRNRNGSSSSPGKQKEGDGDRTLDSRDPLKEETIKADEVFCEAEKVIESDLSTSDLYARYKKDGLQFDSDWQERMVERHQLLQEQRRQRQQLAATKRLYIESERTVSAVNAYHRRASHSPRSSPRSRPSTAVPVVLEFPSSTSSPGLLPVSSSQSILSRSGAESCFRYRLSHLNKDDTYNNISPVASINSFAEQQMQQRPPSRYSIPPKMSYVLVDLKKRSKPQVPAPTKMERELMSLRFPTRYQLLQRPQHSAAQHATTNSNKAARARPNTGVNLASARSPSTSSTKQRAKSARVLMNGYFHTPPLISVLHRKKQYYKPTKFGNYQ